jgi:hypothetical protein
MIQTIKEHRQTHSKTNREGPSENDRGGQSKYKENPSARPDWDPSKGPEALLRNIGPMSMSDCVKPECFLLMHHKLTMLSEDFDN